MYINRILSEIQTFLYPVYNKSLVLKNIDYLIFLSIILVIISSGVAQSDFIGYFALLSIGLTFVKLIVTPNEKFVLSVADKFLLAYFLFVLISVAGSSLFLLSIKGFFKTVTYIGFYISFIHYIKDNRDKIKFILLTIALVVIGESFVALKQNFLAVSEISGWQDV